MDEATTTQPHVRRGELFFRREKVFPNEALGLMQEHGETFEAFTKRVDAIAQARGIQVGWVERSMVYPVFDGDVRLGRVVETMDGEVVVFDRANKHLGLFASVEAAFVALGASPTLKLTRQYF
jgi:hypothetical protein